MSNHEHDGIVADSHVITVERGVSHTVHHHRVLLIAPVPDGGTPGEVRPWRGGAASERYFRGGCPGGGSGPKGLLGAKFEFGTDEVVLQILFVISFASVMIQDEVITRSSSRALRSINNPL